MKTHRYGGSVHHVWTSRKYMVFSLGLGQKKKKKKNFKCQEFQMSRMSNLSYILCPWLTDWPINQIVEITQIQIVKISIKLSKCKSNCQNINQIVKLSQYQMSYVISVCRLTQRIDCVLIFSIFHTYNNYAI